MMRRWVVTVVVAIAAASAVAGIGSGAIGGSDSAVGGGSVSSGRVGGGGSSAAADTTTYWLNPDGATIASGPGNLSSTLTVNGTAMTLVLDYDARNAAATWAGSTGPLLTRSAGSTTLSRAPFTETAARGAVVSANSVRYQALSDTTSGDITATEDIAIELVQCVSSGADNPYPFAKAAGAGGWWIGFTTVVDVLIYDGVNSRTSTATPVTRGACYHFLLFGDHDQATASQSLVYYLNGSPTSLSGGMSTIGAMASGTGVTLLNLDSSSGNYGQTSGKGLISARMWKCSACFAGGATNPTQWQAIARERLAKVAGTYPTTATGTAYPTTSSRASVGYTDLDIDEDGVRHAFIMGAHWPRTAKRKEATGGEYGEGTLIERGSTNIALENETLGTAPWVSMGAPYDSTVAANVVAGPNGFTTADGLIGTAPNNSHPREQQSISLTDTTVYTVSSFFKDGDSATTHATLYLGGGGAPDDGASVLLSACTNANVGRYAAASTITARAEDWGNGWCRLIFTFTADATAATTSIFLGAGGSGYDDNGVDDTGYVGNGATVDVYVWGTQLETGRTATSPIRTTTASATRQNDDLRFASASNYPASQPVTIEAKVLLPSYSDTATERRAFGCGTNATNENYLRVQVGASNVWGARGYAASVLQYDIDGTTDVTSGEIVTGRTTATTNSIKLYTNGVQQGSEDTSATVPVSSMTDCQMGRHASSSGFELDGLLLSARIWSTVVTP